MNYWYQQPHQLLSGYVKTVLVIDCADPSQPAKVPLFTGGMPALVWRVEQDSNGVEHTALLSLYAKSPPAEALTADDYTTIIAFFFMPFVLPCIFNVSAAALMREPIAMKGAPLITTEQTDPVGTKLTAINQWIINHLDKNRRNCEIIKQATDLLMNDSTAPEILPAVQQQLGLTERSFQRIFKKYVGVTPTQYRRICQFETSFSQLRTMGFDKLADVAYQNGFADQSHFIRAFKEFTNVNPGTYLRQGLGGKEKED